MKKSKIASKNKMFYGLILSSLSENKDSPLLVAHSLFEPQQFVTESIIIPGYLKIDSTQIKNSCCRDNFLVALAEGILTRISFKAYSSVESGFATKIDVIESGYRFEFEITGYERNQTHEFKPVSFEELSDVPDDEKIGHFCELTITVIEG